MLSAKGASFRLSLGRRPRIHGIRNASAESAIHFGAGQLTRAFSALGISMTGPWGNAPRLGWNSTFGVNGHREVTNTSYSVRDRRINLPSRISIVPTPESFR
jgi:hypothetical protein